KYILLLILILGIKSYSQNFDRFTLSIYSEPQHYFESINKKADGFNIGGSIEYQMKYFFVGFQTYYFPELHNISYLDFDGSIGLNYRNKFNDLRIFIDAHIGAINRKGWAHAKIGTRIGVEKYFNSVFFGLVYNFEHAKDNKIYNPKLNGHNRNNFGFKVGFVLN
ncbi:MAG: hypothetical protein KDC67_14625, partial [Ignavibacteriae bacterium]|nr:hypothetical protein [Ignavibacteriota bacterium]